MAAIQIRPASPSEFEIARSWAGQEGWNPGHDDLDPFFSADPAGFYMGWLDNRPISSISVVNYGNGFGFLGFYIVHPEFRGQGFGWQTWCHGMEYLKDCCIGLDGVIDQQANYAKSGFELAGRNIRYSGHPQTNRAISEPEVRQVTDPDLPELRKLDIACFPVPRHRFLRGWTATKGGRQSFGYFADDRCRGLATIRACLTGYKIGPLFAESEHIAQLLFNRAVAAAPAEAEIILDVPEVNSRAVALAEAAGLKAGFETARMYRGTAPELRWDNVFGITTFELG